MSAPKPRKIEVNYENREGRVRPSWDEYFLSITEVVATRSHDAETNVGVVIVDENKRIIATGYNGFPPGCDDHVLPNKRPDKYPFMVHAEINAIASSRQDLRNSTLYITISPCKDCAKAIITAGIKKVVYREDYTGEDSEFVKSLLLSCGVKMSYLPKTKES